MYCKTCQREIDPPPGSAFCPGCGSPLDEGIVPEVSVGEAKDRRNMGGRRPNRIVAGLLALCFGAFGVHKFYLGYTRQGLFMLVGSILSLKLFWGLLFGLFVFVGVLEAVSCFVRDDRQFEAMHADLSRPWF